MSLEGKLLSRARDRLGEIRQANEAETRRRHAEVYARVPALRVTDERIRAIMLELVGLALGHSARSAAELEEESLALQAKRAELLLKNGWPERYLDEIYDCPRCRDSGHLPDGDLCGCLLALYKKEQTKELSSLLRTGEESFERFGLHYYPSAPATEGGTIPRRRMEHILQVCRRYAEGFGRDSENLLFYGGPGLGKTFLSAAIARVVSENGYSVAYDSISAVLAVFEAQKFSRDQADAEEAASRARQLLSCDLLILDDLGTEMTTAFSVSALYTILNTRLRGGKKTIVSTNLGPEPLLSRYGEQIASRLEGEFLRLEFLGTDIRALKKRGQ
jgi:DNA replication protein DnaC